MKATPVFLAGINNSSPAHWQRHWQQKLGGSIWVEHADWDWPSGKTWLADIQRDLKSVPGPKVFIAHSLGCLLLTEWFSKDPSASAAAAFMVAPPDSEGPNFPEGLGFAPGWKTALKVPGLVIASQNDEFGTLDHAWRCANAWSMRLIDLGERGHINAASGLHDWAEGWDHLQSLMRGQNLEF